MQKELKEVEQVSFRECKNENKKFKGIVMESRGRCVERGESLGGGEAESRVKSNAGPRGTIVALECS